MRLAIFAFTLLFAGSAWAGAGDLHLQPCQEKKLKQPMKCGTYTVWENREAKSGRTIDLNVKVLQATAADRKPDPIVVLLGGPGEAATSAAAWYGDDPANADRDVVLVDARGTGKSNGLHCPIPKDGPLQGFMPTLNVPVLKACRLELQKRADLRYYLTTYAMDDLDDLRAALGYDKINLDGGSYGTRASLVYIRQHGDHVRTASCGAAPPSRSRCRCISRQTPKALCTTSSATAMPNPHAKRPFPIWKPTTNELSSAARMDQCA